MSQVDKMVKWCLNKAKKELEKGESHRGLVKIEPDIEEAKRHLEKAEHNFKAISAFEKIGFSDWSISAVFYTIYHCFSAIASKFGYESRNQICTVALMQSLNEEKKIDIDDDIIQALQTMEQYKKKEGTVIELRENFQYGTDMSVEGKTLSELRQLCQRAVEETKRVIYT